MTFQFGGHVTVDCNSSWATSLTMISLRAIKWERSSESKRLNDSSRQIFMVRCRVEGSQAWQFGGQVSRKSHLVIVAPLVLLKGCAVWYLYADVEEGGCHQSIHDLYNFTVMENSAVKLRLPLLSLCSDGGRYCCRIDPSMTWKIWWPCKSWLRNWTFPFPPSFCVVMGASTARLKGLFTSVEWNTKDVSWYSKSLNWWNRKDAMKQFLVIQFSWLEWGAEIRILDT